MSDDDPRVVRTRERVVTAATELLLEGGVAALTVEAVIQRSGVARSTIYRHWPTRTDLVATAFSKLMALPPEAPPSGTLQERLEAVVLPVAEDIGTEAYAALVPSLLSDAARDPELRPFRDRFVAAQEGRVADVIADAVHDGDLPAGTDPHEAASQLVGPLLFHRVVLGRDVDRAMGRRMVALFLASHAR
jgi:AcrR family transcriptional regulator